MSSIYVREEVKQFILNNFLNEALVDFTGEYDSIKDMLDKNGLTQRDNFLGIQFLSPDELPASVFSNNTNGKYRETGIIFLHISEPVVGGGEVDKILLRGEVIRDKFRGQRINDVVINSVTPVNFEASGTLQFEGGFTSGSIIVNYYRDKSL